MKLIITNHEDHITVEVQSGVLAKDIYTFDDYKQARSFCIGFICARKHASEAVQSLPMSYDLFS